MISGNQKKNEQLGMPYGTACARLRKSILFSLLKETGKNICFQCGKIIESEKELSIEHKINWLDSENPKELFFDLKNIAFSHLSCNISVARRDKAQRRNTHRELIINGKSKRTKITKELLLNIREDLKTLTRKEVCQKYNLSKSSLAMIARGETFSYM